MHEIHKYNVKIIGSDSKPVAYLDHLFSLWFDTINLGCSIIYSITIKLSIFLYDPEFRSYESNLSFGFYFTCTLVFWLPNFDKFDKFHSLLSMNEKLTTEYCRGVDMQK